jgi:hypothetical protein
MKEVGVGNIEERIETKVMQAKYIILPGRVPARQVGFQRTTTLFIIVNNRAVFTVK